MLQTGSYRDDPMVPQDSPVKRAAFHDFLHRQHGQTSLFGRPRPLIKLCLIPELHLYDSATLIPRRREPPILTEKLKSAESAQPISDGFNAFVRSAAL